MYKISSWRLRTIGVLGLFITSSFALNLKSHDESWTRLLRKTLTPQEIEHYAQRSQMLFSRSDLKPFNQLIFSWNAFRPEKGYFSFFVQVRDKRTKQWYGWHALADWGKDIQRSYFNRHSDGTAFHHVRLEVPQGKMADSFRVKIIAREGASLAMMRSVAVNISNLHLFNADLIADGLCLPSVMIAKIPRQSQMVLDHPRAETMCSPTSCSMLLGYIQQQSINAVQFALNVYDDGLDTFGSWPFNVAHAFHCCNGAALFHVARLRSFSALHDYLMRDMPVVVSVRGQLNGAPREYLHGHLILVIGWDAHNQYVICHDPAVMGDDQVQISYKLDDFCRAWGRSHCLSYIADRIPVQNKLNNFIDY